MCDAETMDQSDRGIFKTEEGLQDLKNNANILTMEQFFSSQQCYTRDSKYRESERTKSKIIDEDYLKFDVLKAFFNLFKQYSIQQSQESIVDVGTRLVAAYHLGTKEPTY